MPLAAQAQNAASVATLYSFDPSQGAFHPNSLLHGSDGNFYGTTQSGAQTYYGTVFRLTPDGALTILHRFAPGDGLFPNAGLIQGSDGNLYGTTASDGSNNGLVFQVTPAGGFKVLHSFSFIDGNTRAGVVQGRDGSLYGTTLAGTIYRVSTTGSFTMIAKDRNVLASGLVLGRDGNFYGTDYTTSSSGVIATANAFFRVTPAGAFKILGMFPSDAGDNASTLTEGNDGNFYGTTATYNYNTFGAVYRFSPTGTYTLLHRFTTSGDAARSARSRLTQGDDGNFYGTTVGDGTYNSGTVFRITPDGDFTSLYNFDGKDGDSPGYEDSALLRDSDGSFYGTTYSSGNRSGTVFKLTVQPDFFTGADALANGVYYLAFSSGNPFGYYSFLSDPHYLYHFDLGYEYVFNADDGQKGAYLYDFTSQTFFYTSPTFPFPYLYDFRLNTVLYYYPDPNNAGRYNTNGTRYFYRFDTGQIITK